jgi:sulfoxide reductase catalytic subunit YedY
MLIKRPADIRPTEITDKECYLQRRRFLRATVGTSAALLTSATTLVPRSVYAKHKTYADARESSLSTDETPTSYEDITSYNNFYEFGTGKEDPAQNAQDFKTEPWSIEVAGECARPGRYPLEDFIKPHTLEERIYRLRCVEAWSMVIPWVGIPLAPVLKRFQPNSNAKFVAFQTLYDPQQMPGQRRPILDWPYVEGLRIDEAMHPLTIFAVGLYGEELPNQNGAPIRLVVPWKYGFKSIKSIVRVEFTERPPATSWNVFAPHEYGFYANVNPHVDHPRWSQKKERRIGGDSSSWLAFLTPKQETLMFNGYGDQVAHLYAGMDLSKDF